MSTPRTDIEFAAASGAAKYAEDITVRLLNHARALEAELARCREALAKEYDLCAEWKAVLQPETAAACREFAAALRDFSKPTPELP